MRIGILNYHRSYNYGAFLQCYSLKERIKKDFPDCEVEVIDYIKKDVYDGYKNSVASYDEKIAKEIQKRNQGFEDNFKFLDLSDRSFIDNGYDAVFEYINQRYDIVVVGSDAVWNWDSRGLPNVYFLKEFKGHKLSYAASAHLLRFDKVTDEQKKFLKEAWNEFDYIGVRDTATDNFIKSVDPSIKTEHNCDPSLFLDIDSLNVNENELKTKIESYGIDTEKGIIGLMASEKNLGRELSLKFGKKRVAAAYAPNKYGTFIGDLSPFEWAKIFSFFDATVTHYFHGTLFSLKNLTPAFPIEAQSAYSRLYTTKIEDVLLRLDLNDWRSVTNYNKIQRGLRRYGFYYDIKLWNKTFGLIKQCNENKQQSRERIEKAIALEAETYNNFANALKNILDKEK